MIIFSKYMESHLQHFEEILSTLAKSNITIKLAECDFLTQKVRYLEHFIEPGKLSIYETIIKALNEANMPRNQQ